MPTAISIDDRAQLRRWAFSSALVVAVHAAILAAALSWRFAIAPLNSPSTLPANPLLIDLSPLPAASSPTPSEPKQREPKSVPAPARVEGAGGPAPVTMTAPTPAPIEPAKRVGAEEATVKGSENAQPIPPGVGAPAAPAAAQPVAGQGDAAPRTSSGGGAAIQPAVPGSDLGRAPADASPTVGNPAGSAPPMTLRVDPGPIDTSITVQPPQQRVKPIGGLALPGLGLVRPMERPGERNNHRNLPPLGSATNARDQGFHIPGVRIPGPFGRGDARLDEPAKASRPAQAIRNAIGGVAAVSPGEGTRPAGEASHAIGEGLRSTGEVRNALGEPVAGSPGGVGLTSASNRTATNAIGVTVHPHPINPGEVKTDPIATAHSAPTAGIINGTGMMRAGARGGVIGGPATRTAVSGVISGTDFRPRLR